MDHQQYTTSLTTRDASSLAGPIGTPFLTTATTSCVDFNWLDVSAGNTNGFLGTEVPSTPALQTHLQRQPRPNWDVPSLPFGQLSLFPSNEYLPYVDHQTVGFPFLTSEYGQPSPTETNCSNIPTPTPPSKPRRTRPPPHLRNRIASAKARRKRRDAEQKLTEADRSMMDKRDRMLDEENALRRELHELRDQMRMHQSCGSRCRMIHEYLKKTKHWDKEEEKKILYGFVVSPR
ncbi:hypothetical protein QBC43DRAFT_93775 [Cladorrhinum sp. PSN259]|nr:hypothetical protein QBC43DRAFT_93775 [Cladorrhinum sp. PSN259]